MQQRVRGLSTLQSAARSQLLVAVPVGVAEVACSTCRRPRRTRSPDLGPRAVVSEKKTDALRRLVRVSVIYIFLFYTFFFRAFSRVKTRLHIDTHTAARTTARAESHVDAFNASLTRACNSQSATTYFCAWFGSDVYSNERSWLPTRRRTRPCSAVVVCCSVWCKVQYARRAS